MNFRPANRVVGFGFYNEVNSLDKIIAIILVILLVIVSIIIVFGSLFLGITGFLNLFGASYDSISQLLLFVLNYLLIGLILDFIAIFLIRITTQNLIGKYKSFLTRMIIDCTFSFIAFHTADEVIEGINIPIITEVIAVIFFFLVELAFEDIEKKKPKKEQLN